MYLLKFSPKVSGLVVFVLHPRGGDTLVGCSFVCQLLLFPTATNTTCVPTLAPYYPLPYFVAALLLDLSMRLIRPAKNSICSM